MARRISFYADEHVPRSVVRGLRSRGVDVVGVAEIRAHGLTDADHLGRALSEGRVVVTQDADFLRLHASGSRHAGIVFADARLGVGDWIRGLMLVYQVLDADEMVGHVEFL